MTMMVAGSGVEALSTGLGKGGAWLVGAVAIPVAWRPASRS